MINLSNAKLNPICHLLTLLGIHPIFHVSRIRVNVLFQTSCNNDKTIPSVSYTKNVYDAKYLNEVTHHAEKCCNRNLMSIKCY
jgi:hypothetical protein